MARRKSMRERGKLQFSRAFQELSEGDTVAVVREVSMQPAFPKRIQGRTGTVSGKQGRSVVVKLMDINKEKTFIVDPIHLKKIKQIGKKE